MKKSRHKIIAKSSFIDANIWILSCAIISLIYFSYELGLKPYKWDTCIYLQILKYYITAFMHILQMVMILAALFNFLNAKLAQR